MKKISLSFFLVLSFGIFLLNPIHYVLAIDSLDLTDGKLVFETSGNGDAITEEFEAVEGPLEVRITHQTAGAYSYFSIHFESDANLNGEFCDPAEYCNLLMQSAYEEIIDLKTTDTWESFFGGKGRFNVSAPGSWTISVYQHPTPKHTITGNVVAGLLDNPTIKVSTEDVEVTALSSDGNSYTATTNYIGDYTLTVYGYTDYTITASLPKYDESVQKVARKDFLDLKRVRWSITKNFDLKSAPNVGVSADIGNKKSLLSKILPEWLSVSVSLVIIILLVSILLVWLFFIRRSSKF